MERVIDPSPVSFLDLGVDWGWFDLVPQLLICEEFGPSDVEDVPEASVDKCLEFEGVGLCYPPGF